MSEASASMINAGALAKPKAFLRYAEWFCTLITFALIADGGYQYWPGNNVSQYAAFMAWGIISWILVMIILITYIIRPLAAKAKIMNLFELFLDACILTYGIISAICYFVKVHDLTPKSDKHIAAAVFGSFSILCFIISAVLDIVSCTKPSVEQTADAAA